MQFKPSHGWAVFFTFLAIFSALSTRVVFATDEIVPFSGSGGGGGVTAVTGSPPVASSGGTTPAISIPAATSSVNGYLTSTDWSTFNAKQAAGSYQTSALTQNYAWAGNASNAAEATNTTLLGDVKAAAKNQTATITINNQAVVTATAHGLSSCDKLYFTTTGALPTGLLANTTYYAAPSSANALHLGTSCANVQALTYIDTSGSQSGVHTLYSGGFTLKTLTSASFNQLGLTSNAHTLTFQYGGTATNDYTWKFPTTAPAAGQALGVTDTSQSPSMDLGWITPASATYALAPVVCLAIGVNFFVDDFSANGGSCNANFGGVAYGSGSGLGGLFAQGDRILFVNTTNEVDFRDDGIYYADNGGSVIRTTDADSAAELNAGTVTELNDATGSAFNHSIWTQTANIVTIDVTPQSWKQVGSVTATAPLISSGGVAPNLSIPVATSSVNGYLSSTNWSAFNGKAASGANADITSLAHVTKLYPAADSTAALQFYKADGSTVIATVDTTNKRIGIGSATPAVSLDVVSATANLAGLVVTSNTNNAADQLGIMAKGPNVNDSAIGLYNTSGGGSHWTFRSNTNGNFEFIDSTAGQLDGVFQASTGNFGIGTGTPGAKLRVHGDHIKVTGTASTATVNANAGTGASCTVSNADDTAGTINLTTTGVASASGAECAVNFHSAYGVAPICVTTPVSANAIVDAVIQGVYFTTSTSALTVNFANTDAIGRTYNWSYMCIETQ